MSAELVKTFGSVTLHARLGDNYIPTAGLCRLSKKKRNDYWRNKTTQEFVEELAGDAGIPASQIVDVRKGNVKGDNTGGQQGTWIHPELAIDFVRWASPKFAVQVAKWVRQLVTTGQVELDPSPLAHSTPLDLAQLRAELREDLTAAILAAISPIITELRALAAPQVHERWATIPRQCQRFWARPQRECGKTNGSTPEGQVRHIHLDSRELKRLGGHASWPNSKSTWRQSP